MDGIEMVILLKKFGILMLAACMLFPVGSVYGHGFGVDTISCVDVQGNRLSISVEMPM
jgi:hypothetical protein